MEDNTGTSIHKKGQKWFLAARGAKFRTIEVWRRLYASQEGLAKGRKDALVEELKVAGRVKDGVNDAKHSAGEKLQEAVADIASFISIEGISAALYEMVKDETQSGWGLTKGPRAQLDERNVLYELASNLSYETRTDFDAAAEVYSTW